MTFWGSQEKWWNGSIVSNTFFLTEIFSQNYSTPMFAVLRRILLSLLLAGGVLALAPSTTNAQFARNAAYFELGGNGIFYTLNYERFFTPKISARGGLMTVSVSGTDSGTDVSATFNVVPLTANYFLGSSHRLELGAGPMLFRLTGEADPPGAPSQSAGGTTLGLTSTLGYRYQSPTGGFLFRAGITPFLVSGSFSVWGGLSVGYAF